MRLIDADEIKYTANGCFHPHCKEGNCDVCCHAVVRKGEIDIIPTFEAEPVRHGHWNDVADKVYAKFGEHTYVCSVCKKRAESFVGGSENWWCAHKPNFCPNCGAKMDEVEL